MINKFCPDIAIPPSETLLEILETKNMTRKELADLTNLPIKTITKIFSAEAEITQEIAMQFEKILGVPASFWMNLQANYNETVARIKKWNKEENI